MADDQTLSRIAEAMEKSALAMEKHAQAIKMSKAPTIWQIEDIATWIHKSYDHTRDRVVKMPGFPEQVPSGGWFADEVIEFYRLNKGKMRLAA